MPKSNKYTDELRRIRSLLIVTSLQKRNDLKAIKLINDYQQQLTWKPLQNLLIDEGAWDYITKTKRYNPKLVFCHPEILLYKPVTSLYYRGLCGLPLKAVRDYFGSVDTLETGNSRTKLVPEKALRMARIYNLFICSILNNSTEWTLENGNRTIIATLGITMDGIMRNKVGTIAEDRVRNLILEWLLDNKLIVEPKLKKDQLSEPILHSYVLNKGIKMKFGSEPDISFGDMYKLLATIEIKGGIDPAGALERYGAATKSFQHAVKDSAQCRNFYLAGVFTSELLRRIKEDRLVEKTFNIIDILNKPKVRTKFFTELFHYTLRIT